MNKVYHRLWCCCLTVVSTILFSLPGASAEVLFGCYAVKFGATWCGPCKVLQRQIDGSEICVEKRPADSLPNSPAGKLCKEHAIDSEGMKLCRAVTSIELDELPDDEAAKLCKEYLVRVYPTTVVFRYEYDTETGEGGEKILKTFRGAGSNVVREIESILKSSACIPAKKQRSSTQNNTSSSSSGYGDYDQVVVDSTELENSSEMKQSGESSSMQNFVGEVLFAESAVF